MTHHEQDDMTVRVIPPLAGRRSAGWCSRWSVAATGGLESEDALARLRAGDLGDGVSYWTVERRKIAGWRITMAS